MYVSPRLLLVRCSFSLSCDLCLALLVTLKSQDLTMYRLYEKLKHDAKQNKLPSNEEVCLAANLPSIDLHKSNAIVANLKALPDEPVSVAAVSSNYQ